MGSQPKGNARRRKKIADKIISNTLLTEAEWKWLAVHSTYHLDVKRYKPLVAEDAAKAREAQRRKYVERKQIEADAYRKAYSDILQRMLKKAGDLQEGALDRAIQELQAAEPDVALLRLGISVSKEVADRELGKATQRFEGNVKHSVSQLDKLAEMGELEAIDAYVIEESEVLELEEGAA